MHPSTKDLGVVDDKQVSCAEQIRQRTDVPVVESAGADVKQAGAFSVFGRKPGDLFVGQEVVKVGEGVGHGVLGGVG